MVLGRGGIHDMPPSNPFTNEGMEGEDDDDDDDSINSDGYVNGDDAYAEYGETASSSNANKKTGRVELWKDDIRAKNKASKDIGGHSFEMVPLSNGKDAGDFNYDNEDDVLHGDDDDDEHIRQPHQHSSSYTSFSGDDYATSNTWLPKRVYQYLYPPNVPRAVQLCRPENIAVPACYLLVGLLQGLSGPFTNVYPLDLNASEAQQESTYYFLLALYHVNALFCSCTPIPTTSFSHLYITNNRQRYQA